MILPIPPFMHIPVATTEEGRARQDRRMTRDLAIMALATCALVGILLTYLSSAPVAFAFIAAAATVSAVGAIAMERWKISGSSVVLGAMGIVIVAFSGLAWSGLQS